MTKVRICVELSEQHYHDLEREANRRGIPIETLVEQSVNKLIEEFETEIEEGTDHPISTP